MRRELVVVMSGVSVVVVGVSLRAGQSGPLSAVATAATPGVVTAAPSVAATPAPPRPTTPAPSGTTTPAPGPSAARTPHATSSRTASATHLPATPRTTLPAPPPTHVATPTVTVNGNPVDTPYGPVQVQISLRGGQIVRADAILFPSGGGRDQQINSQAIPALDQETVTAQSARIDTVSGATYTSQGYRGSLQSALDAAHRAGVR